MFLPGKTHVDPFNITELDLIINKLRSISQDDAANLAQFWFCTGLRPGELMAIRWEDVDWTGQKIRTRRN